VLRLVPDEVRERVRRHLYEARVRAAAAAGSALLMASLDIARQQLVTGGSKAISESVSAAARLRSGVTTEGGSVILDCAS